MTAISHSLCDRARRITAQNSDPEAVPLPPPAVAAQNPLDEILIAELEASLPKELAEPLRNRPTVAEIQHCLAAAALYKLVASDRYLRQQFINDLNDPGTLPRDANRLLVKAVASRMEPPVRPAEWHQRDRCGLILQLTGAAVTLAARAVLFWLLGNEILARPVEFTLGRLLRGGLALDLLTGEFAGGLLTPFLLALPGLWLAFEAVVVPRLLERFRQWPAAHRQMPPPLSWRIDAFYVLWFWQAAVLLGLLGLGAAVHLGQQLLSAQVTLTVRLMLPFAIFLHPLIAYAVVKRSKAVFKTGTQNIREGNSNQHF